jgi:hypothetical protein
MTDDRIAGGAATGRQLMNAARGAKGVALIGFLLPWVTVSCDGRAMIHMSGLDMATGNARPVENPFAGLPGPIAAAPNPMADAARGFQADIFVIVVALLIAGGLVAALVLPRRRGALVGMVTSAAAAALAGYEVLIRIPTAFRDSVADMARASVGGGTSAPSAWARRELEKAAEAASIDAQYGFWVTLLALVAAAVLFKIVYGPRRAGPRVTPEATPPDV